MDALTAALVAVEEHADKLRGAAGTNGDKGDPGPRGPQGPKGKPGLVWRGDWKRDATYDVPDAVEVDGSSFVATGPSKGSKPPKGSWDLLAKRGQDGEPGQRGPRGSGSEGGGAPSGPAGGDLAGTYPDPTVQDDSHAHTGATVTGFPPTATFNDHSARHEDGGADEISLAGLAGTPVAVSDHLGDASAAHAASAITGALTILPSSGNVWAADTPVALGYRTDQVGVNLSFLIWEVTTAGTTNSTEPDWEGVPLASAPIPDNDVEWTFRGYVGKVLGGAQSIESEPHASGNTGSSIITEAGTVDEAGDLYVRGGHGATGEPGGVIGLQGGKGDAGVELGAFLYVYGGGATGAGVGGNIEMYGGDGSAIGGEVLIRSGYGTAPGANAGNIGISAADASDGTAGATFVLQGAQEAVSGGFILFNGGSAQGGLPGGDVTFTGGVGDDGDDNPAQVVVQGGRGDGNTGRVGITTGGTSGSTGEVITAQGDGFALWANLLTVQTGTPVAGGFVTPLVFDDAATTGGLYGWDGADYTRLGLATT